MIITDKVKELFKIARTKCGAPIRSVQITDDQMCDLLKVAIGDYSEYVQNWVLESQWLNLQGKQQLLQNPAEAAYALTVRTMDWSRDYSYWFSREVGLQQRGVDGIVGNVTINKINSYDGKTLFTKLWHVREDFIKTRAQFPIYGKGWLRRLNGIQYGKLVNAK